jgi:MYXO-CTERM domain-containing protein
MKSQKSSRIGVSASLLLTLAMTSTAWAQPQVPYVSTQYAETYTPVTGGTPILFSSIDDGARMLPIGFSFPYYGNDYSYLNIGVNGLVAFAQPCISGQCISFSESCDPGANVCSRSFMSTGSSGPLPTSSDPQATIAVFWDDLILDSANQPTAQVVTQLSGAAPNRVFTVEWQNIRHYPRPAGTGFSYVSLKLRLHEGTGLIYLSYGDFTGGSNNSAWSGILGIEDHTGAEGISPQTCSSNQNQCSYVDLSSLANQTFQIGPLTTAELIGEIRPSTGGNIGDPITVELDAQNVGTVTSSVGFSADIYFSADPIITPGSDTLLGTVTFPVVAAGASNTQTLTSSVPAGSAAGYYTIGAVIDSTNAVSEAVETNNTVSVPNGFLVGSEVSLAMDTVVAAPDGQVSTLTFRIVNEGSALPAVGWNLYLSTDRTLDSSDVLVATGTSAVPAQPETTVTTSTILPSRMPANYILIGVIDPAGAITEADESNNEAASAPFLIGAELRVAITAPSISGPGEPVDLQLELINDGWEIGSVAWSIYVSLDQTFDVMDTPVTTGTSAMGRLRSLSLTVSTTVPLGILPQDQYFIAIIDPNNVVAEVDENNNVGLAPDSTEMVGPDIAAESVTGALSMYRGESYIVETVLKNEGGATAENFYCGFYLSDNLLITVTDPLLDEIGPITLGPGETRTIRHTVSSSRTGQLTAGLYHLGIIADSRTTVLEERENNNIKRMQEATVEVRDPAPDFVVTEVRTSRLGSAGESVRLQRILENLGNAAGTMAYSIYLSSDRSFDLMGDQQIGTGSQQLAPGQQHSNIDTVRIPSNTGAGAYYVVYVADADALVDELDELNNVSFSVQTINIEVSSLQILSQVLPLGTIDLSYDFIFAAVGGSSNLSWSVGMGVLPPGISLNAAEGRLTGVPTVEGAFPIEISVTDGALVSTRNFNFIVAAPSIGLNLITRGVPPAWIGRNYSYPLTARGGIPPYQWSADGIIPRGLVLSAEGVIDGVPIIAGSNVITFRVVDALGAFDERPIAIRIIGSDDAVRFSTDILRDGVVNRMYDETLRAINGVSPYTFELADGELPPGLVLEANKISGVPTTVGLYNFAIRVIDNRGDFDLNHFVVTVVAEDSLQFVTNGLPAGKIGQAYLSEDGTPVLLKSISPAGNNTVTYAIVDGELPPGITLAQSGLFEGIPTTEGVFDFLVAAVDGQNQTSIAGLGILVFKPAEADNIDTVDPDSCGCQTTTSGDSGGLSSLLLLAALLLFATRRLRKFACVAVICGLASWTSQVSAQSIPYFHSETTEPYVARTGGTPLSFSSMDDGEVTATLPFAFKFFAATHTSVKASTNGYLMFGTGRATDFSNEAIPASGTPNSMIAAAWDDLTSPTASLHIEGTAPSRVAIIQYANATHLGSSSGTLDFQFKLYEGPSGKFEIHYGNPSTVSNNLTASVGYENDTGSQGHAFMTCTPNCGAADFTSAGNRVYRALQDAGEDIMAGPVAAPASVYQAISFDVQTTIISQHQNPIGPFQFAIHLMSSGEVTPNNPIFTSTTGITLTAYEVRQVVSSISIPIQTLPGRYRLALEVDVNNDVMEPDENNNIFIGQSDILVAERLPDFTVPSISVAEQTLAPGGTANINLEIENAGNLAGAANWEIFISPNAVVSVDDISVHTGSVSLASLTSQSQQLQVLIPTSIAPGRYWIGAIVDTTNAVLELDEINNVGATADPVAVGVSFVDITTPSLPGGYMGIDYSTFLQATGGDGQFEWAKISGDWPDGMSMVPSTGEIRGRPNLEGDYPLVFRVTSNGLTAEKPLTLSIASLTGGLTIATRNLLPGIVGQDYPPVEPGSPPGAGQRIIALGGTGVTMFSLAGLPPPGLTMDSDGFLAGVPGQSGRFDVQVVATDGTETSSRTLTLTVVEPGRLTLVSEVLEAEVEESYRHPLQALGESDTATLSFSLQAGALPPGLALTENGLIVGVPIGVSQTDFAVEVVEGSGPTAPRDTANYTIIVTSSADFAITPSELQAATVGTPYEATLSARGGTPPLTWTIGPVIGSFPRGLRYEVDTSSGRESVKIIGTPEELPAGPSASQPPVGCACGIATLLVEVRDSAGRQTRRSISLQIGLAASTIGTTGTSDSDGCSCAAIDSAQNRESKGLFAGLFVIFALILRRRRTAIR